MKHLRNQNAPESKPPDVLKHLADSLERGWKRYRKRLKRCQESFSEEAVHDSRVETRRFLATVELLGAFIPESDLKKARSALKEHLDTFDDLRDTQVQLIYVKRMEGKFAGAGELSKWLKKREERFTRKTRKRINCIKTKRLRRCICAYEKEIRRRRKVMARARAFDIVQHAMSRAFGSVARLCARVDATDTETIHCTRIAFKRFRYMAEGLSPLLPSVTDQHRHAMRGYQSMMGDIQDVEVLIEALDKFIAKKKIDARSAQQLRNELLRRRQLLVRVYMNAADRLRQFWPPPDAAHSHSHSKK